MNSNILLIEDDEVLRRTLTVVLRKEGYDITAAGSGDEGVKIATAKPPDLVLSDVNMAGLDGFGVLRALRANPATAAAPVILMTGVPERMDLRQGMNCGADDYLAKPFEMETLLTAVRTRLERHHAIQAQATVNESRLLEVLSATQDLVAIEDSATGHLLYLNSAGRKILGLQPGEDIWNLRLEDFRVQRQSGEPASFETPSGVWVGETEFVSRTGARIPMSQQVLSHEARNGQPGYISVVARDISDRKQAENDRQLMEVQLRQAQKLEAIGQLAAGIAHEINTPTQYVGDNTRFLKDAFQSLERVLRAHQQSLAAVKAGRSANEAAAELEALAEAEDLEYLFEQIPAAINETLEGVERITKIVRAMREFSHPGGKEKSMADLNKAIESTVTVARNEWKYVADLKLDLDPKLPLVPCFLGEFNQAILNLVVNAAHAIGDVVKNNPGTKGAIVISTRHDGEEVEVRVSDTGTGIPEANRGRIFEPFFTTKEVGKGTGQGLSIVYGSIVKHHGGQVHFETETGKGTTFVLRLPIQGGAASSGPMMSATDSTPETAAAAEPTKPHA